MKTEREIDNMAGDILDKQEEIENGVSRGYTGMTYEEGLRDALEWVLGNGDNPLEDEG